MGNEGKFFSRGKVHELQAELEEVKSIKNNKAKKSVLKRIIANLTMGNDMLPLADSVISMLGDKDIEIKKMVYLYLVTYCRARPDLAKKAFGEIAKDIYDSNPLVRASALRTLSNLPIDDILESIDAPLKKALGDEDPYVSRTAALCIAKLYSYHPQIVRQSVLLEYLTGLLENNNPTVTANAIAACMYISEQAPDFEFKLDPGIAGKLILCLDDCSEWSQIYVLEGIMTLKPASASEAIQLVERLAPRLQHSNSAIILSCVRIILYFTNFCETATQMETLLKRCGPPLISLLNSKPEIQFVALKNIDLILQKHPRFLTDITVFFCKYRDPIYVKLTKLEIIFQLADKENMELVLQELHEYATEVDIEFVRNAVRTIGHCAIKVESFASKCVSILVELIQTKISYIVQESAIVMREIFRRYPNQFESVIVVLCENLDILDEPESKAAIIWILGQYADRIENAEQLFMQFMTNFADEPEGVQFALLTAILKMFVNRPSAGAKIVPMVLKAATEDVDNPDLRDRGFMYWRMLTTDRNLAAKIIMADTPKLSLETRNMKPKLLAVLLHQVSKLSSLTCQLPNISDRIQQYLLELHEASSKLIQEHEKELSAKLANGEKQVERNIDESLKSKMEIANPYTNSDLITAKAERMNITNSTVLDLTPAPAQMYGDLPYDLFSDVTSTSYQISKDVDIFSRHPGISKEQAPNDIKSTSKLPETPSSIPLIPTSISASPHNPFSPPAAVVVNNQLPMETNYVAQQSPLLQQATGYNNMNYVPVPDSIIDPFRNTSLIERVYSTEEGELLISSQKGNGLEVRGQFVKKNGSASLGLMFVNHTTLLMNQFGILFNQNTFGLVADTLPITMILSPGQTVTIPIKLLFGGLKVKMNPINNIQVAVKNNFGIYYFQKTIPIHILFTDISVVTSAQDWIQRWNNPQLLMSNFMTLKVINVELVEGIVINGRTFVDGVEHYYCSTVIAGELMLFEVYYHNGLHVNAKGLLKEIVDILGPALANQIN